MSDDNLPADAPWWARWLVAEWRDGWKWLGVQLPIWCGIAIEVYTAMGDHAERYLPPEIVPHLAAAAFWINALQTVLRKRTPGAATEPKP